MHPYRHFFRTLLVRLFFLCLLPAPYLQAQAGGAHQFEPGEAGVKQMLEFVLEADKKELVELTRSLQPDKADYAAVFVPPYDKKVWRFHRRLRRYADIIVHPILRGQTDYVMWRATTDELQAYTGEARNFPGGFREMAAHLQPDLTFYRFKFIEPGHKLGSAYDALVYVNGHWRIFHRPWSVLLE